MTTNPFSTDSLVPNWAKAAAILKGDLPGHPFHGNQYESGGGGVRGNLVSEGGIEQYLGKLDGLAGDVSQSGSDFYQLAAEPSGDYDRDAIAEKQSDLLGHCDSIDAALKSYPARFDDENAPGHDEYFQRKDEVSSAVRNLRDTLNQYDPNDKENEELDSWASDVHDATTRVTDYLGDMEDFILGR